MCKVPDLTESELDLIHQTPEARQEKNFEAQCADVEIHLSPDYRFRPSPARNRNRRGTRLAPTAISTTLREMPTVHERGQHLDPPGA